MWLGRTNSRFPFSPYTKSHTKKSNTKKPRTKFWTPLLKKPVISSRIHNHSDYTLSKHETQLLNLGLKHILPSSPPPPLILLKEFDSLSRTLRLKHFFKDEDNSPLNPFKLPNPSWQPPTKYIPLESIIVKHQTLFRNTLHKLKLKPNRIPLHLSQALRSLRNNNRIIILPADKNIGVCVLNKDTYYNKVVEHLSDSNTYRVVSHYPLEELSYRLKKIVNNHLGTLTTIEANYILHKPSTGYQVCNLYFLPKLHKNPMGFRPICSYNNSLFEQTSKWLHHQLMPILLLQKQYLKDSHSLIQTLEHLKPPPNSFIFTFDVESLYPSIPPKLGLEALRKIITPHFSTSKTNLIYTLSALTLEYHFLSFDDVIYQQVKGTAMGSNFSVVYACLFLAHLENSQPPHPNLCFFTRYIDDAFGIWTGTKLELENYLQFYNTSTNNCIKLTITTSPSRLPFLDLWINLKNSKFSFNCYQKPQNAYQYLPFSSEHPLHLKRHFIINELKRYLIRESTPLGFRRMKKLFFTRLITRGYPPSFIKENYKNVPFMVRKSLIYSRKPKSTLLPVIFKLRYTRVTPKIGIHDILKNLHEDLLLDPKLSHIPRPFVCWTKSKSIHSFLVKTKYKRSSPKSLT